MRADDVTPTLFLPLLDPTPFSLAATAAAADDCNDGVDTVSK